jgi:hypothetical protein
VLILGDFKLSEINTCVGVDSKAVMGNIIGRAIFWQKTPELGAVGKVDGEESMGNGSTVSYYCQ